MKATHSRLVWVLAALVVIEAVIIGFLGITLAQRRIWIAQSASTVDAPNPLVQALNYEAPLTKFEALVASNPAWVNYRDSALSEEDDMSVLARCALLGLTNHVRVLIENGADVQRAIQWHKKYGSDEAVMLIERIAAHHSTPQ